MKMLWTVYVLTCVIVGSAVGWALYRLFASSSPMLTLVFAASGGFVGHALRMLYIALYGSFFTTHAVFAAGIILIAAGITLWWLMKGRHHWKGFRKAADRFLRKLLDKVREALTPPVMLPPIPVRA